MSSRRLRHAPEERQRAFADARDVLAPRLVGEEEAGRRVDDVVERGLVEAAGGGLFLLEVLGVEPGGHLLLDVRDVRPAEPGAVAVGPDRDVDRRVDAVGTRVPGVEHRPAALPRRRFLRPALAGRAPVGGDEVDVHADALQELGRDVALPLGDRLVLRHDAGHRLVGVAALGEELLCRGDVALALEDVAALLVVERRARREISGQRLPQAVVVADEGPHVLLLVERHEDRAAGPHIAERRVQVVHAEGADVAERIGDVDRDVAVLPEHRHEVGDRVLPPIDLAVLQRRRGRSGIGHDDPLDAVDHHLLAAGERRRRRLARHVVGELLEHRLCARNPFALGELHRSRADILVDLLERIGLGEALRHDERHRRRVLGERQLHLGIGLREHPAEGAVVDGGELLLDCLEHEAQRIARRPARQARDHVLGAHRLAVVEFEAGTKLEGPGQPVVGGLLGFDHLALRLQLVVEAVERVPDERRGVADDVLGAPDRVEIGKVRLRHEAQRPRRGALRDGRRRKAAAARDDARRAHALQKSLRSISSSPVFSRRLVGGQSAQLFGALREGMWSDAPQPVAQGGLPARLMPSARRELATAAAAGEADSGRRRGGQMDPADLGATELTALFAKGLLSPLEALDAAEARIRRLNPVLNAIVTLDPEGARSAARASSARWAKRTPLSALDGVPVTIKDNLLVRGLRATWGSRLYADFLPDTDELPVARLRGAGAVILGKTNVPELTLQGYTDNPLFGPTRNPGTRR